MSLTNTIIHFMLMKKRAFYNKQKPFDYNKRRQEEIQTEGSFKLPKTITIENQSINGIPIEWIISQTNPKDKILYYIHGGGFVSGSSQARRRFTTYLASKIGYNVISVDYRLAPENPYPKGLDDCFRVYQSLHEIYGNENIFILGESAGGNLVLSCCLRIKDIYGKLPAGIGMFSPTLQYLENFESYSKYIDKDCMVSNLHEEVIDIYFQTDDKDVLSHPYASPLNGNFSGFCPVFLTVSDHEVLKDDAYSLKEMLEKENIKLEFIHRKGMVHAYMIIPDLSESKKDLKILKRFIQSCFA